jgi:peptide/nickel transport system permease protein
VSPPRPPASSEVRTGGAAVAVPVAGSPLGTIAPEQALERVVSPARAFTAGVVRSRTGRAGLAILLLVTLIAALGPFVRPHDPAAVIGLPLTAPSGRALLGTDFLGRDLLSRFLSGGWLLILAAVVSTSAAYLTGGMLGLWAGYRRGRIVDLATIGIVDVFISIPPIIFALVLVAGVGGGVIIIAIAISAVQIPPVTRLVRAFTLTVCTSEYVEAAVARGERTSAILVREILPNLRSLILADFGIRVSWSVILFASLSFLGFGQAPPAADWGLMISENRIGLVTQPLVVLAPVFAIAALTIGINLTADAFARAIGRTSGGHP